MFYSCTSHSTTENKAYFLHFVLQVLLLLALSEAASQLAQFPLHCLPVLVPLGSLLLQTLVELDLVLAHSFLDDREDAYSETENI